MLLKKHCHGNLFRRLYIHAVMCLQRSVLKTRERWITASETRRKNPDRDRMGDGSDRWGWIPYPVVAGGRDRLPVHPVMEKLIGSLLKYPAQDIDWLCFLEEANA